MTIQNTATIYNTPGIYNQGQGGGGGGGSEGVEINGRFYKTTIINGVTWLAENLILTDFSPINPGGDPATKAAFYKDKSFVWAYGYLFNFYAVQAINIEGWHVPTREEMQNLINYVVNANKLKDNIWNGDNEFNFSARPAGYYYDNSFLEEMSGAHFWTNTQDDEDFGYCLSLGTGSPSFGRYYKRCGCSVRLIKD